jgi:hypothetical protein
MRLRASYFFTSVIYLLIYLSQQIGLTFKGVRGFALPILLSACLSLIAI